MLTKRTDRQELTETIRELALQEGADLVGFAPIARFDNAPPHLHPRTLFPPVRSAIAIGLVQPRGTLKAIEEGCYWQAYHCDSYWYLNEVESTRILWRLVMRLEAEGCTSLPVHNPFQSFSGRPVREDQLRGPDALMSLRVLGVAAGLGELGLSKVFLSPEFGPRQRIFGVLTDAELEPTPLFRGKVCDECGACARECEAGAIGRERSVTFRIEDVEFGHGELNCEACVKVHQGMDPRFSPFWNGSEKEGEAPAYNRFCKERFRHLAICGGRGCLRACLDHLEKRGRITTRFKTPFIERKRWKLNEPPAPKAMESER
jgi:epoxyqueuosine reductase QueG